MDDKNSLPIQTRLANPVVMVRQMEGLREVMNRLGTSYETAVLVKQRVDGVLEVSRRLQALRSSALPPIIAQKVAHLSES